MYDEYSIKGLILENDNKHIIKVYSIKKNVTCLKIRHFYIIFLQNEASYTVHRELLYF